MTKDPSDTIKDFMSMFDPANMNKMFDPKALMEQFGLKPGDFDPQETMRKAQGSLEAMSQAGEGVPQPWAPSAMRDTGTTGTTSVLRRSRASSTRSISTGRTAMPASRPARSSTTGSPNTTSTASARTSETEAALRTTSGPTPAGSPMEMARIGSRFTGWPLKRRPPRPR